MEFSKEIEKLIQKFTEGVLTEEEDKLLAKIVGQNQAVRQELVEALQFDDAMGQVLNDFRSKEMFKRGFIFRLEADTVIFDKKPRSVEKKTKSKNYLGAMLALAACLVIGVFAFMYQANNMQSGDSIVLTQISGEGQFVAGDTIETNQQELLLQYSDQTSVTIKAHSLVKVEKTEAAIKHLTLQKGSAVLKVAKQPENKPMKVFTEFAEVEVLGTEFSLTVKEDYTELFLTEGRVRFSSSFTSENMLVEAGQIARLGRNVSSLENIGKEVSGSPIKHFSLVNLETSKVFAEYDVLQDGQQISLASLGSKGFGLLANINDHVGAMTFKIKRPDGETLRKVEFNAPFIFKFEESYGLLEPGVYKIEAHPRTQNGKDDEKVNFTLEIVF